MDLLQQARTLTEAGLTILPVVGKRVHVPEWSTLIGEETLSAKYKDYWSKATGIGLLCGESSGVICLDIDREKDDVFNEIMERLPPIYSGKIGNPDRAASRFFKWNGEPARKFNNLQVEILSSGNQTVLPPSIHPNTKKPYTWAGIPLTSISDIEDLPDLPTGFFDWLSSRDQELKKQSPTNSEFIAEAKRCKHGSHNAISKLAVGMFKRGLPFDRLLKLVINKDKEINFDADYFYFNCPTRPWKSKNIKENASDFIQEIVINHGPGGKYDSPEETSIREKFTPQEKAIIEAGFYEAMTNKKGEVFESPAYHVMAKYMAEMLYAKIDDSYQVIYENEKYNFISRIGLGNKIETLTGRKLKPVHIDNFIKMAKIHCYLPREDFIPASRLLNLKNGALNLDTKKMIPHSPDHNFTYKLSHEYRPNDDCPNFLNALMFIFDGDVEMIKLVGEIFGYTLLGGYPFAHKAFMLYGEGRNGKSTVLHALQELLGRQNYSSVSMRLIDKPFSMVRLDGKLANIVDESPTNIDHESFKNIVGGGTVTAAKKGMDEYDLQVHARLFFACNDFPRFRDATVAVRDRLIILPFQKYIPEKDRDMKINDKISKEVSGILNFALAGLARLESQDGIFTKPSAVDDVREQYERETDTVVGWFKESIQLDKSIEGWEYKKNLYKKYAAAMDEMRHQPVSETTFYKRLGALIPKDHHYKRNDGRAISGIKFVDNKH